MGSWVKLRGEQIFWKCGARSHRLRSRCFQCIITTSSLSQYDLATKYIPNWRGKSWKTIKIGNSNKANTLFIIHFFFCVLFFFLLFWFLIFFSKELAKGNPYQTLNSNSSLNFIQKEQISFFWIRSLILSLNNQNPLKDLNALY